MAMRSGHILVALTLLSSPALAQKKPAAKTAPKAAKPAPTVDPERAAHFSLDLSPSEDPPPPVTLNPPPAADAPSANDAASPADATPTPAPEIHKPADGMATTDLPPSDVAEPAAVGSTPAPIPETSPAGPDTPPAAGGSGASTPEATEAPAAPPGETGDPAGAEKPADATPAPAPDQPPVDAAAPASSGEPFQPPPPTFLTVRSAVHFSADTPIIDLIADPQAKAVLDKDLPGLTEDKNLDKFKFLTLRGFQPMTGGQLTDDMLKTVNDDLAALGKAAPEPVAKKRKFDGR